jgi:acyl carrier protein
MSDELTQRILRVIADAQRLPPEKVTIDKSFEELGIDSMDGVSLLFALENEFDINIPDDAAKSIRTVREMVEGVSHIVEHGGIAPGAAVAPPPEHEATDALPKPVAKPAE